MSNYSHRLGFDRLGSAPASEPGSCIVLAGGCFWCTEAVFERVRGVLALECGYANGHLAQPSYAQVCSGGSGHAEALRLQFDPAQVGLETLLQIFFATHDPTTPNRQGYDIGPQYRSGIYWSLPQQGEAARALIERLQAERVFGAAAIVTEVEPLRCFYRAEEEHQRFYARHPRHGYCVAVAAPKLAQLRQRFAAQLSEPR